jgi:uncharacterized membrane protein YgdD (TMEM256/DUF423 family)
MTRNQIFISATILAGLGVGLGAVGAHAFKDLLIQNARTETYETAVRYQLFHAVALFLAGLLPEKKNGLITWVAMLFLSGSVLFSGSLFMLSFTAIKWVVFVTPVGGLFMITGWVLLLVHFLKRGQ